MANETKRRPGEQSLSSQPKSGQPTGSPSQKSRQPQQQQQQKPQDNSREPGGANPDVQENLPGHDVETDRADDRRRIDVERE